ncbi:hypothetical protein ABIF66_008415 [Bradyrhizobium japonicum]
MAPFLFAGDICRARRVGKAKRAHHLSASETKTVGTLRFAHPTDTENPMLTGSCLCGGVAYEVDAPPGTIMHCHCQTCRKTHGSAFSTVTNVPRDRFRWTRGEDLLRGFESSPAKPAISARNADRTSSPRARARTRSCCGWAASKHRSQNGPKCTSGDRIPPTGTTRRPNYQSGPKAPHQKPDRFLASSCCHAQQQVDSSRPQSLDSRNAPRANSYTK